MIDRMQFGRTGHESSRVILGAAAFWAMPIQLTVGDTSLRVDPAAALNGVPLPPLNPETSR